MIFTAKYFHELTAAEVYEILRSRCEVFMLEQNIVCQDMDRVDYRCLHCMLTTDDGEVAGYLRAFYGDCPDTVVIGRVLTVEHGKGLGRSLMEKSIKVILEQMKPRRIMLHAQTQASGFYAKFGFKECSSVFFEEGVPHIEMEKVFEDIT